MSGIIFNQLATEFGRIFVPTICFGLIVISLALLLAAISAALRSHINSSRTATTAIGRWVGAIALLVISVLVLDTFTPIWKYCFQVSEGTRHTVVATLAMLYTAPTIITMFSLARSVLAQLGHSNQ